MTPHEQQVYANFTTNLKRFASNAAVAAQQVRQGGQSPSEESLRELATSTYDLESQCGEVLKLHDSEMELQTHLVQNILHSPVHPNLRSGKKISLYHAATTMAENGNPEELTDLVRAAARNPNQTERMVNNLYRICAQINALLQEKKMS